MRYAKMIDGIPVFAPNPITSGGIRYGNPPEALYLTLEYKPAAERPRPDEALQPGFRWEPHWIETANAIELEWLLTEIPPEEELSPEEALDILLGGEVT